MFFGAILLKSLFVGGGGKADQKSFKYLYLFKKQGLFSAPVNRQKKKYTSSRAISSFTLKRVYSSHQISLQGEKEKKSKSPLAQEKKFSHHHCLDWKTGKTCKQGYHFLSSVKTVTRATKFHCPSWILHKWQDSFNNLFLTTPIVWSKPWFCTCACTHTHTHTHVRMHTYTHTQSLAHMRTHTKKQPKCTVPGKIIWHWRYPSFLAAFT